MNGHCGGDAAWHREQQGIKMYSEHEVKNMLDNMADNIIAYIDSCRKRGVTDTEILEYIRESMEKDSLTRVNL